MKFTIDGVDYDGALMQRFETTDPAEPTIFLDRYCQVFVVRLKNNQISVSQALTPDIYKLFQRHGIEALLRALRAPPPV
jgi:hypothetical protein